MKPSLATAIQLIMTDAIQFFVRHLVQIATLCLPFLLLTAAFQYVLNEAYPSNPAAFVAPMLLSLLVYPIYTAALIQLMARRARQEKPGSGELILSALPRWSALLMLRVIIAFLLLLGFSLFVIPGVWIMVRISFAEIYLVLFGLSPREALEKSSRTTAGNFWLILALLALTYLPILILILTMNQVLQNMSPNALLEIAVVTGWSFLELFVPVVVFRAFMEVTAGKQQAQ